VTHLKRQWAITDVQTRTRAVCDGANAIGRRGEDEGKRFSEGWEVVAKQTRHLGFWAHMHVNSDIGTLRLENPRALSGSDFTPLENARRDSGSKSTGCSLGDEDAAAFSFLKGPTQPMTSLPLSRMRSVTRPLNCAGVCSR
jgi:hypothetical protein